MNIESLKPFVLRAFEEYQMYVDPARVDTPKSFYLDEETLYLSAWFVDSFIDKIVSEVKEAEPTAVTPDVVRQACVLILPYELRKKVQNMYEKIIANEKFIRSDGSRVIQYRLWENIEASRTTSLDMPSSVFMIVVGVNPQKRRLTAKINNTQNGPGGVGSFEIIFRKLVIVKS